MSHGANNYQISSNTCTELFDNVRKNLAEQSYVNVLNCREKLYISTSQAFQYIEDIFRVLHKHLCDKPNANG